MKKIALAMTILVLLAAAGCKKSAAGTAGKPVTLDTQKKKASYALGSDIGQNFKKLEIELDSESMTLGIEDTMRGGKQLMTADEMKAVLNELRQTIVKKQEAKSQLSAAGNRKIEEEFLAANAKKEGVKTTASGLQYKILTNGKGPKPKLTDTVKVHYSGTLINGTEFDSSYKRGQPVTFPLNGVIKGWTEALQLMPIGSKWMLFIPSQLGYGDQGAGATIPPASTLIFEVELLGIEKPAVEKPVEPKTVKK
jgi:FKBP-type peptidyl-prolyl cis-trans isomerase